MNTFFKSAVAFGACLVFLGCGETNGPSLLSSGSTTTTNQPMRFTNGQAATLVIGQTDFVTGTSGATQSKLNYPTNVTVSAAGQLFISDLNNYRLMGFDVVPSTPGPNADFVLGQPDFTTHAHGSAGPNSFRAFSSASAGSLMAVVDTTYNRVLFYNPIPSATGTLPNYVFGATSTAVAGSGACTSSTLSQPSNIYIQGGKMFVSDGAHRVLIFNTIPTATGATADLVLGQPNLTTCTAHSSAPAASTIDDAEGVWSDGTRLAVVDSATNRVLIWNTFPTTNGQPADIVLGQTNFVSNGANAGGSVSAVGMVYPEGVWSDGTMLAVGDENNNRVLIWSTFPTTTGQPADVVLGQTNMTSNSTGTTASTLNDVYTLSGYGNMLFVTDAGNNRVLGYLSQ